MAIVDCTCSFLATYSYAGLMSGVGQLGPKVGSHLMLSAVRVNRVKVILQS